MAAPLTNTPTVLIRTVHDPAQVPAPASTVADGRERGGATSVEMALVWAAMLAFILAVAQVAIVFYAGQLALTAAQDGLHTGRTYPAVSPQQQARSDAEAFLRRAAGTTLAAPTVAAEVTDNGTTLTVTVSGDALSLIPGGRYRIQKQAVGQIEHLTP
jgi:Flp pilus assembly protein TadG